MFAALAVTLCGAAALYAFRPPGRSIDDETAAATAGANVTSAGEKPVAYGVVDAPADEADARAAAQQLAPERVTPSLAELMLPDGRLPPPLSEAQETFAAEPVDPVWAPEAEARILSEIATATGRPMVTLQAECRSTVCRLQVVERDLAPLGSARSDANGIPQAVTAMASSTRDLLSGIGLEPRGAMSIPDASGSRVLLAYFGRYFAEKPQPGGD